MQFKENVDYMFIDNPIDDNLYAVKLLKGPYEGVEYFYTAIRGVTETENRLNAILSFNYEVLHDPGEIITDVKDFQNHIGDILTSHITSINQSEFPEDQMRLDEEPRSDNPPELDSERAVC